MSATMPRRLGGKVLVNRRRNRHTGADVLLYHLGDVPHGRKQPDVEQTPWLVVCRSHSYATKVGERREALEFAAAPFGWCDECHRIMLGEAPKVAS